MKEEREGEREREMWFMKVGFLEEIEVDVSVKFFLGLGFFFR